MIGGGGAFLIEPVGTNDGGVDPGAVHDQLQRILSDPLFHASKRYSDMLKYVVDQTLEGRHESLKERIIGIEVFERPLDYDTSVDSIVRVAAAEVRKRLVKYYSAAEHDQELRIGLPIRSYVAVFAVPERAIEKEPASSIRPDLQEEPDSFPLPIPQDRKPVPRRRTFPRSILWIAIAACALLCVSWSVERVYGPSRALDRFWAPMLQSGGKPLIAIGSPVWLTVPGAAVDAIPMPPHSGMTYSQLITHQENFPIADLSAASALTSFLARHQKDSVIRLSDSATLLELHGNPLIVLGSFPNEWALRLGADLPFEFRHDGAVQWIESTSEPQDKNWTVNVRAPYEQITSDYALVTRAVDKTTGQWWIGIGGVTVLGTIAAQQMIVDPQEMALITAGLPKDWDRKNLQFVIEVKMVKGSPGASQLVAAKTW